MKNKNIMVHLFASFAVFLSSSFCWSGQNEVGNGGKAVYCEQPDGSQKLYTLDYMRAEWAWSLPPQYAEGADEIEKAVNIVRRIKDVDPIRSMMYVHQIKNFFKIWKVRFVSNPIDWTTDDTSNEYSTCKNPKIVQVMVQYKPNPDRKPYEPQVDFMIYETYWNQLDADQKAGLLLHETILREKLDSAENTDPIMWFNAHLTSNHPSLRDSDNYATILNATNLLNINLSNSSKYMRTIAVDGKIPYTYNFYYPYELASKIKLSRRKGSLLVDYVLAHLEIPHFGGLRSCDNYTIEEWTKIFNSLKKNDIFHFTYAYSGKSITLSPCLKSIEVIKSNP